MRNLLILLTAILAVGCSKTDNVFKTSKGYVKLQVIDDDIVRVMVSPVDTFSTRNSLAVTGTQKNVQYSTSETDTDYILSTSRLNIEVNKSTGKIVFKDTDGNIILSERENGTFIIPDKVCGEDTWNVRQQWESKDKEVFLE